MNQLVWRVTVDNDDADADGSHWGSSTLWKQQYRLYWCLRERWILEIIHSLGGSSWFVLSLPVTLLRLEKLLFIVIRYDSSLLRIVVFKC